jgi:NAD+ synthase (glutamine-hydrolysing)
MKISLAQINTHIGNFGENRDIIRAQVKKARKEGSDLVVFPELAIGGYPPLDLLERKEFIDQCARELQLLATETRNIGILIGAPTYNPAPGGKNLLNSAYFLHSGSIQRIFHKSLLPTYDIFDEYRYFEPNTDFNLLEFRGKRIAVTICEDLWDEQPFDQVFGKNRLYPLSPMDELAKLKPDLIINIAASPFSYRRVDVKKKIFTGKARKHHLPVLYINQVGAQTELIFEGASLAINPLGEVVCQLPFFEEALVTIDLEELVRGGKKQPVTSRDEISLIHDGLILGIRDFFRKQNLNTAILGLSGGIDSAVCLALTVAALGPENVRVLLMPSRYSSTGSVDDGRQIAERLGIKADLVSIESAFRVMEETLTPLLTGTTRDITEENLQARIRAVYLMAVSNKLGNLLINTSNKSEAAVGYGTLYGDMCGGLSVLGDVYKTDVYHLAQYINRNEEIIPRNSLQKPPSAELKENQRDSDSLPEYPVLDPILYHFIELQLSPDEIIKKGFDRDTVLKVVKLVNQSDYKRYQAPPILRISSKAFGFGRRIPIVARKNWGA